MPDDVCDPGMFRTYTLFDHPDDYPECYVLRTHAVLSGWPDPIPEGVQLFADVADAREWCVKRGLARMERHPTDPPGVIEVWL